MGIAHDAQFPSMRVEEDQVVVWISERGGSSDTHVTMNGSGAELNRDPPLIVAHHVQIRERPLVVSLSEHASVDWWLRRHCGPVQLASSCVSTLWTMWKKAPRCAM